MLQFTKSSESERFSVSYNYMFMPHVHSLSFILTFKEHQKCVFKASRKAKMQLFPAPSIVALTRRTLIKNNHNLSQAAGPGKKATVMLACSFIAKEKLEFLPFFSESSPALKYCWLRPCNKTGILQRYMWVFFRDSNSFYNCLKQQMKNRNVNENFSLIATLMKMFRWPFLFRSIIFKL